MTTTTKIPNTKKESPLENFSGKIRPLENYRGKIPPSGGDSEEACNICRKVGVVDRWLERWRRWIGEMGGV